MDRLLRGRINGGACGLVFGEVESIIHWPGVVKFNDIDTKVGP